LFPQNYHLHDFKIANITANFCTLLNTVFITPAAPAVAAVVLCDFCSQPQLLSAMIRDPNEAAP
jgi:hypothetical protein